MRLRNIPGANEAVAASPYCIQDAAEHRGQWHAFLKMTIRSISKSAWERQISDGSCCVTSRNQLYRHRTLHQCTAARSPENGYPAASKCSFSV